jgi:regulator of protease activity HflC (stomatin/prohibitin superfamily)
MSEDIPLKFYIFLGIIGLIFMGFVASGFLVYVEPGSEGILIDKAGGGVQSEVLAGGEWHFKMPVTQGIEQMKISTQTATDTTSCFSKDLQAVNTTIAVKYRPIAGKTPWLYQNVGMDYKTIIIDPDVQDSIKAVTARYTIEELASKREIIRQEMEDMISKKLKPYNIHVDGIDIVNYDPSKKYADAIEAKQVQQQAVLQKQYELEATMVDANKTRAAAQAEADAINITGKALKSNPDLIKLEAVKKWDGKSPLYYGGSSGGDNVILPTPFKV